MPQLLWHGKRRRMMGSSRFVRLGLLHRLIIAALVIAVLWLIVLSVAG
jgi:hypothetical protein